MTMSNQKQPLPQNAKKALRHQNRLQHFPLFPTPYLSRAPKRLTIQLFCMHIQINIAFNIVYAWNTFNGTQEYDLSPRTKWHTTISVFQYGRQFSVFPANVEWKAANFMHTHIRTTHTWMGCMCLYSMSLLNVPFYSNRSCTLLYNVH